MASRDLVHNIKAVQVTAPGNKVTATVTASSSNSVDTQGFESVCFIIDPGAYTDSTQTFNLYDSPDNSVFTLVTGANVVSNGNVISGAASPALQIGYLGGQRYVACAPTVTGATTGAAYGTVAVLSHAHVQPTF